MHGVTHEVDGPNTRNPVLRRLEGCQSGDLASAYYPGGQSC